MSIKNDSVFCLSAEWIVPVASPPVQNGFVRVRGSRVEAIGRMVDLPEAERPPDPLPGSIITPGLINTHSHLEQSYGACIQPEPNQMFTDWLIQVVEHQKAQAEPGGERRRCEWGALALLASGTTTVNDIASTRDSLETLSEYGLRGIVSLECFHPETEALDVRRMKNIEEAYRHFGSGFERHPLLTVGLSPHSPYNVSPDAWRMLLERCQPPVVHTHLAEFEDEIRYLRGEASAIPCLHERILGRSYRPKTPAVSPVAYLAQFALLNSQLIAAHGIQTTWTDRCLLSDAGVTLAHCPRSNWLLHGRTLDYTVWQRHEIPIGLGTDGRLSTDTLDLRDEARAALCLHGSEVFNAPKLLRLMTLGGAEALRLERRIGSLEAGKQADLVLWQAARERRTSSPEECVLDAATRARQVWVDGRSRWKESR